MMIWFDGSIPDAINLVKQKKLIFVIVIIGEDEQSQNLVASWEDDDVSEMTQKCCVAIKVDAKSDTCVQFSQIYPVVCIPSSFFIGENGIPLEVIAGSVSPTELQIRINKVQQMHGQKIAPGMVSQDISATVISQTQPANAALSAPSMPFISPEDVMSSAAVDGNKVIGSRQSPMTIAASGHSDHTGLSCMSEEILDLQKLNMEPDEWHQQNTTLTEEDRVDRAASYSKYLEEKAQQVKLQTELEAMKGTSVRPRSNVTRLQFRLPDGSTFTNQFSSHSKLQEAQHFVQQEIRSRYGNLSMATMFPRREFTSEDLDKTLLELQLSPSSSIVLLPSGTPVSTVVPSTKGGTWAVLSTVFYPVLTIWRFLRSFMFLTRPQETSRSSQTWSQSYTNSATCSDEPNRKAPAKHDSTTPMLHSKDGVLGMELIIRLPPNMGISFQAF
ncbi:UBX domain-containing protein 4 isoform X2 [Syngnathoides biaculeatus]|uniref:UBX domain-containing protein 4 isoform X2 n=1 Tax=Syngnathoides biaculeatus TaxID=300417 RepID=UPI002ADE46F4|nr:UBX domain-containing protein 4 isoform X2 [Syngnathoides biaculeatus]